MTLFGKDEVERALHGAVDDYVKRLGAALYTVGANVVTAAKRLTPHDTGTLMGSGYETLPDNSGGVLSVELGFGGHAKDYAVPQHENTSYQHDPGRQCWYLNEPLQKLRPRFLQELARALSLRSGAVIGQLITDPMQGELHPPQKSRKRTPGAARAYRERSGRPSRARSRGGRA